MSLDRLSGYRDRHPDCRQLVGTPGQVKYGEDVRNKALDLDVWTEEQLVMLKDITDSTWWIANQRDLPLGRYKPPAIHQLGSGSSPPVGSALPEDEGPARPRSNFRGPVPLEDRGNFGEAYKPVRNFLDDDENFETAVPAPARRRRRPMDEASYPASSSDYGQPSEAEQWAESVAYNPKMAKATLLALVAKLAGPNGRPLLARSRQLMDDARDCFNKDLNFLETLLQ